MINKLKFSLILIVLLAAIGMSITAGSAKHGSEPCNEAKGDYRIESPHVIVMSKGKMIKEHGKMLLVKVVSFDKGVVRGTVVQPQADSNDPMQKFHKMLMVSPEDITALSAKGEFTFNLPPKPDFKHEMKSEDCIIVMKSTKGAEATSWFEGDNCKGDKDCMKGKDCAGNCKDGKDCMKGKDCSGNCKDDKDCMKGKDCAGNCKDGKVECKVNVIKMKDGKIIVTTDVKPEKGKYRVESKNGKKIYIQEFKFEKGKDENARYFVDGKPMPPFEGGKFMPPNACPTCGQPMPPKMMYFSDPKPGDILPLLVTEEELKSALNGMNTTFKVISLMMPPPMPERMPMMHMKEMQHKKQENCTKECEQPCK